MTAALEIHGLDVLYGRAIEAVRGLTLTVPEGGFVALLGANGAGKSTILKAVSGILPFENGRVVSGSVAFEGKDLAGVPSHRRARRGLLHVREGRHVFAPMTVEENLASAGFAAAGRGGFPKARDFDEIYDYFPQLTERRQTYAGLISGGEQQMLAIGRALIARPTLLLVDEASLGLAPMIAQDIFDILTRINADKKLSILVVEQNLTLALKHASYAYILENGSVAMEGTSADLSDRERVTASYLGGGAEAPAAH